MAQMTFLRTRGDPARPLGAEGATTQTSCPHATASGGSQGWAHSLRSQTMLCGGCSWSLFCLSKLVGLISGTRLLIPFCVDFPVLSKAPSPQPGILLSRLVPQQPAAVDGTPLGRPRSPRPPQPTGCAGHRGRRWRLKGGSAERRMDGLHAGQHRK